MYTLITKQPSLLSVTFLVLLNASPKWRLNLGTGTKKKCPISMNRGVPSTEVKDTKIV